MLEMNRRSMFNIFSFLVMLETDVFKGVDREINCKDHTLVILFSRRMNLFSKTIERAGFG